MTNKYNAGQLKGEIIQRQKKYGFKVDKWITIREKNMFGML